VASVPPLGISGVQLNAAIASGSGSLVDSVAFSMTGAVQLGIPLVTLNNVKFVYQRRVGSVRASRRCLGQRRRAWRSAPAGAIPAGAALIPRERARAGCLCFDACLPPSARSLRPSAAVWLVFVNRAASQIAGQFQLTAWQPPLAVALQTWQCDGTVAGVGVGVLLSFAKVNGKTTLSVFQATATVSGAAL
jgi:hypothetical protein